MKQRLFSIALALCLCFSSLSVAYAGQEGPLPSGDVPGGTEGAADESIRDDDGNTDPRAEEGNLTEEPSPEPIRDDDGNTDPRAEGGQSYRRALIRTNPR